jgi:hypothetical protein
MNALKQPSFKDWIKQNFWTITLGLVMVWLGWQQERVKAQQDEIHSMMKQMISDVKDQCKTFEEEIKEMKAAQVYDRRDLDYIIWELDLKKELDEHRKTSRSRGGIVLNPQTERK